MAGVKSSFISFDEFMQITQEMKSKKKLPLRTEQVEKKNFFNVDRGA